MGLPCIFSQHSVDGKYNIVLLNGHAMEVTVLGLAQWMLVINLDVGRG